MLSCTDLPRFDAELRNPRPNMLARRIVRDVNEDAREVTRRKMKTKAFFESRNRRKRVEMRFAHLKTHSVPARGSPINSPAFSTASTQSGHRQRRGTGWLSPSVARVQCPARCRTTDRLPSGRNQSLRTEEACSKGL